MPCRSPAMTNGRCRMHGGASPGAPVGNTNAFKHGNPSSRSMAGRREFGSSKVSSSPYTAPQAPAVALSGSGSGGISNPPGQARLGGHVDERVGGPDGEDILAGDRLRVTYAVSDLPV